MYKTLDCKYPSLSFFLEILLDFIINQWKILFIQLHICHIFILCVKYLYWLCKAIVPQYKAFIIYLLWISSTFSLFIIDLNTRKNQLWVSSSLKAQPFFFLHFKNYFYLYDGVLKEKKYNYNFIHLILYSLYNIK